MYTYFFLENKLEAEVLLHSRNFGPFHVWEDEMYWNRAKVWRWTSRTKRPTSFKLRLITFTCFFNMLKHARSIEWFKIWSALLSNCVQKCCEGLCSLRFGLVYFMTPQNYTHSELKIRLHIWLAYPTTSYGWNCSLYQFGLRIENNGIKDKCR